MSLSPSPSGIAEADVRALVRLLGETAARPGGHLDKKTYLLDGLCELVGADEWRWARMTSSSQLLTGLRRRCQSLHGRLEDPPQVWMTDKKALSSASVGEGAIFSKRKLDATSTGFLALCRDAGRPPYTDRESRLAKLVLEEVSWLHAADWPERVSSNEKALAPRQRLVLDRLLLSQSRKQIADELGISVNTVSSYTRELYRRFHVRSHRELLSRLLAASLRSLSWGGLLPFFNLLGEQCLPT